MAFKYNSLGTDKSLEDVARNALAKIHGPKGPLSDEKKEEGRQAKQKGVRRGTPKGVPANAADAKRAENAAAQRAKDSKQSVADAAGRAPARPPINPGKPKPGGKK